MARYGARTFLPYGVDDDSIIFRSPLTSEASFTSPEIGTANSFTANITSGVFDAVKGFNAKGDSNLSINQLTNYADLDNAGQISFELQTEWVCTYDPTNGSHGFLPVASQEQMLTISPGTGADDILLYRNKIGNQAYMACWFNGMVIATPDYYKDFKQQGGAQTCYVHSGNKGEWVTINIGWSGGPEGGEIMVSIDGLPYSGDKRNNGTDANLFQNIFIGSSPTSTSFVQDHYIRNLQISTRPPSRTVNKLVRKIAVLSDSMFEIDDFTSVRRDAISSMALRRRMQANGFSIGDLSVDVNSGYTIDTTGSNDLFDATNMTALENQRASIVVIRGGTNDVIQELTIDSTWFTNFKTQLTTILGWDATEAIVVSSVPGQSVCNSVAHNATRQANLLQINDYMSQLPAWNSKVYFHDAYTELGGESPADDVFLGQELGNNNNVHFAGKGHEINGTGLADFILENIL